MQEKIKKGKFTHIKEIQAFQKYFETAYTPNDLGRTICQAVVTLKEKFTEKLGSLKFPLYVKPKQRYEITFNLYPLTIPRLPTADFGVALRPPFLEWFVCGNVKKIL